MAKKKTYTNRPTETETQPYDLFGSIIAYENGELGEEQVVELFQYLINTGLAWRFQGSYGRQAARFIEEGLCHRKGE